MATELGRLQHVSEGEFLVVWSRDYVGVPARPFAGEGDALSFLSGVVLEGDGRRQLGDLFYHVDVGSARPFHDAEVMNAVASQLVAGAIRLVRDPWLYTVAKRHDATNQGTPRTETLVGTVIHTTRGVGTPLKEVQKEKSKKAWHFTVARDGTIYQHVALSHTVPHAGKAELDIGTKVAIDDEVSERTIGIEVANLGGVLRSTDFGPAARAAVQKHLDECTDTDSAGNPKFPCKELVRSGQALWFMWQPPKKEGAPGSVGHVVQVGSLKLERAGRPLPVPGEDCPAYWEPFPKVQTNALFRLLGAIRDAGYPEATEYLIPHADVATKPRGRKIDPGPLFPWHEVPAF